MNKVLVYVYVPRIEKTYNLFIPINRKIGLVKKIMCNAIIDLSEGNFSVDEKYYLYNKVTSIPYDDEAFVINTDIRNGSKLILL